MPDDRQGAFALLDGADSLDVQDMVSTMTPLLLQLMGGALPIIWQKARLHKRS